MSVMGWACSREHTRLACKVKYAHECVEVLYDYDLHDEKTTQQ